MTKTLVFERAGVPLKDMNDVGTGRIRTAFHMQDGQAIYLELIAIRKGKYTQSWAEWERTGFVDSCYLMEGDQITPDYDKYPVGYEERYFEWTLDNILTYVNYYLGGGFDNVRIADPEEYRVFKTVSGEHCNFGERKE